MIRFLYLIVTFIGSIGSQALGRETCQALFSAQTLRIAIVEPYSSGNLIAPRFQEAGHEIFFIKDRTIDYPDSARTYRADQVPDQHKFEYDGTEASFNALAEKLRTLGMTHILAGAEPGVLLADRLAFALDLPTQNDNALSLARRNKFEAGKALQGSGLMSIPQIKARESNQAVDFFKAMGEQRVVIKPTQSAGADLVFFCDTVACVEEKFEAVLKTLNVFGLKNEVLVQKFVGDPTLSNEYVVNSVSKDGVHRVSSIWRYFKRLAGTSEAIYWQDVLLPSEGEVQQRLVDYAFKALDALGIRYGPSHLEIMIYNGQPILVDAGARLAGGSFPRVEHLALDHDQMELMFQAYAGTTPWRESRHYNLKNHLVVYEIANPVAGQKLNPTLETLLRKTIPSFQSLTPYRAIDTSLPVSHDLSTMAAEILLLSPSSEQMNRDLELLHRMDQARAFFRP